MRHPRNPWFGLLYAAILLVGTVGGVIAFTSGWREAIGFDMYGQRTEVFVLVAPFLSAAGTVLLLVRGILAIAPWLRYRAATPRDARLVALAMDRSNGRPGTAIITAFGLLALGGFVLLAGFARPQNPLGFGFLLQFDALLLFVAILCLKAGIQAIWANHDLAVRGIPIPEGAGSPRPTLPPPTSAERRPD
ncbi:MAG: hypothetical protein WBL06_13265 [Pseudolysinimonas sp.]|uniref:hypothetical protein n=1 Tax=Pseudolysinimonas sp. TaxID=2680009 RepID=UPI003C7701E3